jgi:hypothetical protein
MAYVDINSSVNSIREHCNVAVRYPCQILDGVELISAKTTCGIRKKSLKDEISDVIFC